MRTLASVTALLLGLALALAARAGAEVQLPVRADGFILAPVDEALGKRITAAQDGKNVAFTVALDGGKAEALAVSPERLRDYQNIYYRIVGEPGSWRLEENGFSPTGADDESKLIRRALGVTDEKKVFFLPGRLHLLIPAKSRAVLRAGKQTWAFQVAAVGGAATGRPTRAVLVRPGQAISLSLSEEISSAKVREGDTVTLTVAEDVLAEGLVAIAKGAETIAKVVRVRPAGSFGAPAAVILELGAVDAVDGSAIPLLAAGSRRVTYAARPSCPFTRGRQVTVPAGATLAATPGWRVPVLAPK